MENSGLNEVRYHDTVNFLQGRIGIPPAPFARAEWLDLLARHTARPVIVAIDGDDGLTALPLMHNGSYLTSLANWYNFTWHPVGQDPVRLARLARALRDRTYRVVLAPCDEATASMLHAAFATSGWRVAREFHDYNHILLPAGRSFAQYWAKRPGRLRTTLKRKAAKVDITILNRFDERTWRDYEAIYRQSWKPAEGDPKLLRAFAEQEGRAGRIRLAIAARRGTAIAAQFWTVENGIAYIHKLAHLPDHDHLSAGTVLTAALFEQVIDVDRVSLIDFGTGDDPYKRDWMEQDRARYRLDCIDGRQPRSWPLLAKRAFRRVALVPAES